MKIFIFVLAIACFSLFGCSDSTSPENDPPEPETYSVTGFVSNGFGSPISGADVFVGSLATKSGLDGSYAIGGLVSAQYVVMCKHEEYFDYEYRSLVIVGSDLKHEIIMEKQWRISLPAVDSFVVNSFSNTSYRDMNFGSNPVLRVGEDPRTSPYDDCYIFFTFNYSQVPPGVIVSSANLTLQRYNPDSQASIGLSQVLGPWEEYGITYNNRPSTQPTDNLPSVVDLETGQSIITVDLRDYVQAIVSGDQFHHGISLTSDDYENFHSRESQTGSGPSLVVVFKY